MSILTREEFGRLVSEYGRAVQLQDVEGEGRRAAEAYDAALARIAELEADLAEATKDAPRKTPRRKGKP